MIAYQCYATGEYVGPIEDYGFLPNGATYEEPPKPKEGFARFFLNNEWRYIEDHRGEAGYIENQYYVIKDAGPYPPGWSVNPPELTTEELFIKLRNERDNRLLEYDKKVSSLNRELRSADTKQAKLISEQIALWDNYANALCKLPSLDGAPWDGGGDKTPWPEKP